MITYWLRLWPQQPIILDDPRLIPGRTLRGALTAVARRGCDPASTHDRGSCSATCTYWPLFGTETPGATIRVGDAIATRTDDLWPIPTSARTCRVAPGFSPEGHGVSDTAIRAWVFEQAIAHPDQLLAPFTACCAQCGADRIGWPSAPGYLIHRANAQWTAVDVPIHPVETAHRSAVAETFTQAGITLAEGAYYAASIDVPEALDTLLRATIREGLLIGGRRTRGAGLVRAELIARPTPETTIRARIQEFNRAIRAEQRFYTLMQGRGGQTGTLAADLDEGAWLFTLDVIDALLPVGQFNPLANIPGMAAVPVVRRWTHAQDHDGYRTASAQRAGTRSTISGTWLYRVSPEADRMATEGTLAYLESHGVGLEAARGGGAVTVCHPFHLVAEPC